jgi:hypothetical protein
MALQQAGMTEMTPLLDNLRHLKLRVFRQIWNRIRQYWTDQRWIRVTDDEKNVRFVGLNVTQGHVAMQKLGEAVKAGQVPMEVARQYEQQIMMSPQMQQPANQVAELDVDIDIDEVAETPTLQIEQFEMATQLMSSGVFGSPPDPRMVKLWVKASNFREKQELLDIAEEMVAAQEQAKTQPNPMQEIQMRAAQAQVAGEEAKVGETQSKTMLNVAKAQSEQTGPLIESFKAGQAQPPLQ